MSPFPLPRLETERLVLSLPPPEDAARVVAFYAQNREHLKRWDPRRPPAFYGTGFWSEQLELNRSEAREGKGARFFLRAQEDPTGPVLGLANFSNVVRGVFQACYLGFSLDAACEGQGLMREALERGIGWAFDELRLHRIMANHRPENLRSGGLLRRLGFVQEGFARDYLFIDGGWRDHVLTALTRPGNPDPGQ